MKPFILILLLSTVTYSCTEKINPRSENIKGNVNKIETIKKVISIENDDFKEPDSLLILRTHTNIEYSNNREDRMTVYNSENKLIVAAKYKYNSKGIIKEISYNKEYQISKALIKDYDLTSRTLSYEDFDSNNSLLIKTMDLYDTSWLLSKLNYVDLKNSEEMQTEYLRDSLGQIKLKRIIEAKTKKIINEINVNYLQFDNFGNWTRKIELGKNDKIGFLYERRITYN